MDEFPDNDLPWRPCATQQTLRARAAMLAAIRRFFDRRQVLEVETPLLSQAGNTDPALASFHCRYTGPGAPQGAERWLPTSPELHMKRLLAAGSGAIYQVCKVFRDGELGRWHAPEFTMLEWYRPGFDHRRLMDEVEALVIELLAPYRNLAPAQRLTYRDAFLRHAAVDPFEASSGELQGRAAALGIHAPASLRGRDEWLDLLLTQCVEPALREYALCFIYDYPASQAALARVRHDLPAVAERFELYLDGVELANGFHELADPAEQARRFEADVQRRERHGVAGPPADRWLLAALEHGLPACAGVALGLDRVLVLALQLSALDQALAFPWNRA